ncbi:hypothetical protein E1I18_02245 [Mycoplasmopsis mucosicanis]|uniref:Uncharacterized protein n=1 Tax=Mycoplasmopsis mucosicanis TaxID=458208 RepID=A0A507SMN1_9BACT|nr:hypothetical protein [Mycoplasmopsis mucosicanis]TQC51485.1 hypothetical protein E1I18_02245 [Mycoplasmopsis mucosicanis]
MVVDPYKFEVNNKSQDVSITNPLLFGAGPNPDKLYDFPLYGIRGKILIRRFFNKDRFYITVIFAAPDDNRNNKLHKDDKPFLSINNLPVDSKMINTSTRIYDLRSLLRSESIFDFSKYPPFNMSEFSRASVYKLVHLNVSSDQLGLKFKDIQSIVFQSSYDYKDSSVWELKIRPNEKKEEYVQVNDGSVEIDIPEIYSFSFGERYGSVLKKEKFYLKNKISFEKLAYEPKTKIAEVKIDSENPYRLNKNNHHDIQLNDDLTRTVMNKNQSLSDYNILEFKGEQWKNLKDRSSIYNKNIEYIYSSGTEKRIFLYEKPTKYDYKHKTIVEGDDYNKKGLMIPYGFKGKLKTSYTYAFDNGGFGKLADYYKVYIQNVEDIKSKKLDPLNGEIKMTIHCKGILKQPLKYSMKQNDIEALLKEKEVDLDYFLKFKLNEEEKNINTNI